MEEQDDEEDGNVDNVVQTKEMAMAESRQSSSQPWTQEMQRQKRKQRHQEAEKLILRTYSATMAMLSSAEKEDICDQYGKTIASELRGLTNFRKGLLKSVPKNGTGHFIDDQDI